MTERALHRKDQCAAGFTLLEILVALAVLAVTLGALLPIFSNTVRNEERLTQERAAISLAQTKLDTLGIETPLMNGASEGRFDNGFGWRLEIDRYPTADNNTLINAKIAILTVRWPRQDSPHSLTVKALRLAGRQ